MTVDLFTGQPFEIKPLTTGENGRGKLMTFSGGKDENHMRRRFLQSLQQCVKSLRRQHMRFINNVYFVISFHRGKLDPFSEDSNFVNSPVGSSVNLQNIHGNLIINPAATRTVITGVGTISPGPAVYCLG